MICISTKKGSINIRSVQANSVYRVNNGYDKAFIDYGNAVISDSLFSEYMQKHGMTVKKKNYSSDFIVMKFEYGVKEESEEKEVMSEDGKPKLDKDGKVKTETITRPSMTAQQLREYYYENGVSIPEMSKAKNAEPKMIKYEMLMRSPGKAKEGECIFIREDLHDIALKYITMGLYEKMPDENAKIVEMSAYSTLVTATAIDYINIPLKNIFVVKDENVSMLKNAVTVKAHEVISESEKLDYKATEDYINDFGFTFYKNKQRENPDLQHIKKTIESLVDSGIDIEKCPKKTKTSIQCYVERNKDGAEISNVLWDGMGLIDDSIFPENKEGFIYCRSHFFKSCLFRGSIQQYFKDYYDGSYENMIVEDMFGRKMQISDIKVIVTENSLKWTKFIDLMGGTSRKAFKYYEKFMKKHGDVFAIIKTAHHSKWGDMQRSSYQINGSLPTTDDNVLKEIANLSIEYCNSLKIDDDAFIEHLKRTGSAKYSINNVLVALNEHNDKFKYTNYFKKKRTDIISRFKKERLQQGKLLQHGDNLTICGNPIALLMKVTKQNFLQEGCFEQIEDGIQCYTTRFRNGEKIAGFRSPHNSPNNIIYLENVYPESIQKYFANLGNNVIIINGIYTDVQSRLNGQDLDSDTIYATNQKEIVELAKKAYKEYPTIINGIKEAGQSEYKKNMLSYAKMDGRISSAQHDIGNASNIAQLALSYYYDKWASMEVLDEELEDVFIICSVLAQIAIDSAKHNYVIKTTPELRRLSNLDCMKIEPKYPRFYADVQKEKDRKSKKKRREIKQSDIGDFICPMDILYRIIDDGVLDLREAKALNTKTKKFTEMFKYDTSISCKRNQDQCKKVESIIKEYDETIKNLDVSKDDYPKEVMNAFEVCSSKIRKYKIKKSTMHYLINYAFNVDGGNKICDRLLTVLYDNFKDVFLDCFIKYKVN